MLRGRTLPEKVVYGHGIRLLRVVLVSFLENVDGQRIERQNLVKRLYIERCNVDALL